MATRCIGATVQLGGVNMPLKNVGLYCSVSSFHLRSSTALGAKLTKIGPINSSGEQIISLGTASVDFVVGFRGDISEVY